MEPLRVKIEYVEEQTNFVYVEIIYEDQKN